MHNAKPPNSVTLNGQALKNEDIHAVCLLKAVRKYIFRMHNYHEKIMIPTSF